MLPPVEPDEALVAHGIYRQLRQGKPTRIEEYWSAHRLPDDAMIWRSEVVFDGTLPLSACYLLRDPQARPVQLFFYWRWREGGDDLIEYRFMPGYATVVQGEEVRELILPARFQVYGWHTVTENLLWLGYDRLLKGWQHFTIVSPGIQHGTLWPRLMTMEAALEGTEIVPGANGPHKGFSFAISMPEMGDQHLIFDEFGVPVRWTLPDENLTVELVEYTRLDL